MIRDLSTTPSQSTRKCSSLHTPCLCVTLSDTFPPTSSPVSHLPYLLPSSVSRNSFVCHSYENCRGVYQQFPFWFTPSEARSLRSACFRGRQKLITFSPTFRTSKRQNFQTFNVFGPILFPFKFLLTLLRFFALFCIHQEPNPFIFKLFRTLCPKTPGVGVPSQPQTGLGHLTDEAEANESGAARPILYFCRPQRGFQPSLAVQFSPSGHISPSSQSKPGGLYP